MQFFKYQGTGNDFVMLDNRAGDISLDTDAIARLCHRRFGIGADGLILLSPSGKADFRMVYFNADGNESTMCGNGGRCLAAFAHDLHISPQHWQEGSPQYVFDAIDGLHEALVTDRTTHADGLVSLRMTRPYGLRQVSESDWWLHTGSPHYVVFADAPVAELDVFHRGREIRYSAPFAADNGTNANFVNILAPNRLQVRTYERGVEDETLSCGTGVTASAYLYLHAHPAQRGQGAVAIQTPGGDLRVRVKAFGSEQEAVWLEGPAVRVFEGKI